MKKFLLPILGIWILLAGSCNKAPEESTQTLEVADSIPLPSLKERGRIVAVTHYNSANYFIYKGRPMGFHYELLVDLADYLGMPFEVIVDDDLENNFEDLSEHKIDIVATNLTVTDERSQYLSFTLPLAHVSQVVVKRSNDRQQIKSVSDLSGQRVYVQKGSAYVTELSRVSETLPDDIKIIEVDVEVEELIRMVSEGQIGLTVCDFNLAKANLKYFDNIEAGIPVSAQKGVAWAVALEDIELQQKVNEWLNDFKKTTKYRYLYAKYFNGDIAGELRDSDYYTFNTKRVSSFDEYIKLYSEDIDWDWRLLASLIYQESRFKPNVKSWAGAQGLMQLMPNTAAKFGVDSLSSPVENIRAGVEFLKWLDKRLQYIEDKDERIKFILASYNAGYGHVQDAMKLAEKYGKDPKVWDENVDLYLLAKSKPEYYNDPDVKYGYCRGSEAYNYVNQILNRYRQYRNIDF